MTNERDMLASIAMPVLLSEWIRGPKGISYDDLAEEAYRVADAMLRYKVDERKGRNPTTYPTMEKKE